MWGGDDKRLWSSIPHVPPFVFPPPALSCPDASLGRGEEEAALALGSPHRPAAARSPPAVTATATTAAASSVLTSPAIRAEGDSRRCATVPSPPVCWRNGAGKKPGMG